MKRLYLVCGLCGSGKTWLRKRAFPKVPTLDMGEIKGDSFGERYSAARGRVLDLFEKSNEVVVEGIFKRGTASFSFWEQFADERNIELVRIVVERDLNVCEKAIKADSRPPAMRLKFLREYAPFA